VSRRYRIGWVFPGNRPPIENALLVVDKDRIVEVRPASRIDDAIDLHDWAIVPGLINAHTHLEFSSIEIPLGEPDMPFAQWIGEVVSYRRGFGEAYGDVQKQAVKKGIAESARHSVVAVGEITTTPCQREDYCGYDLSVVSFLECLGMSMDVQPEVRQRANKHIEPSGHLENVRPALSPHAPYSTRRDMLRWCAARSAERKIPLAMHLAESLPELELLEKGTGPFEEMLDRIGWFDPEEFPGRIEWANYLDLLSSAHRSLVVHGNYLQETDLRFLADNAERMSLCYCPRTHAYFGHAEYPLTKAIELGVRITLGTDSRASNPDLNVWEEVSCVANKFPQVRFEQLLAMVTTNAAYALGLKERYGQIASGSLAQVAAFPIEGDRGEISKQLLQGQPRRWNLATGLSDADLARA